MQMIKSKRTKHTKHATDTGNDDTAVGDNRTNDGLDDDQKFVKGDVILTNSADKAKKVNADGTDYDYANQDDILTFSAADAKAFTVSGIEGLPEGLSKDAVVTDNGDGTFSLKITAGSGYKYTGLIITLKPVPAPAKGSGSSGEVVYQVSFEEIHKAPGFGFVKATYDESHYEVKKGEPLSIGLTVTTGAESVTQNLGGVVVTVDGITVPSELFTVFADENGKLKVELLEEYLKTLSMGTHYLSAVFGSYSYGTMLSV